MSICDDIRCPCGYDVHGISRYDLHPKYVDDTLRCDESCPDSKDHLYACCYLCDSRDKCSVFTATFGGLEGIIREKKIRDHLKEHYGKS
jgi:hypothetical protein